MVAVPFKYTFHTNIGWEIHFGIAFALFWIQNYELFITYSMGEFRLDSIRRSGTEKDVEIVVRRFVTDVYTGTQNALNSACVGIVLISRTKDTTVKKQYSLRHQHCFYVCSTEKIPL